MAAVKAGAVLVIAGAWVLCQILGGQALQRLNVIAGGTPPTSSNSPGGGAGSGSGGGYNGPAGGHVGGGLV